MLDRRAFLTLGSGSVMTLAGEWLAAAGTPVEVVASKGRVNESLVVTLEQRLPLVRQAHFALGGETVRHLADAELSLVRDLLVRGDSPQRLTQRIFGVAAELGRIAGWSSFDAGYHASAERYFSAALRASHSAGDRALGANILKCMSLQLIDAQRPKEALAVAAAAREGASGSSLRVVAMTTVREARVHAALGDTATCEGLLVEADRFMGGADDDESPDWAAHFDRAEYSAQVASCYLLLQRHALADRWLDQALQTQPTERRVDRATYLMWRAEAVYGLGEIDQACSLVSQALPSVATARSARNQRRLADLWRRFARNGCDQNELRIGNPGPGPGGEHPVVAGDPSRRRTHRRPVRRARPAALVDRQTTGRQRRPTRPPGR